MRIQLDRNTFHCKHFKIWQHEDVFPVNTDAVLLAQFVIDSGSFSKVLEVGSGNGLISIAYGTFYSKSKILSLDLDPNAVFCSQCNIKGNDLRNISALQIDFRHFQSDQPYDLIFSNPPFFNSSLKSNAKRNRYSKYNDNLPLTDLLETATRLLDEKGKLCLILPFDQLIVAEQYIKSSKMVVSRVIEIAPKNDIKTNRVLLELTKIDSTKRQERLIIREVDNSYTKQYRAYTKWFYLNF